MILKRRIRELRISNTELKGAFTGRTKRSKQQALIQLQINKVLLDQIFLISPHLFTSLLLGMDFCIDYHVVIDFPQKTIINADDEESATEVAVVHGRPNIESSIDSPLT